MFGATRKIQDSSAKPTVRMSESISTARSRFGLRRLTSRNNPQNKTG